MAPFVLTKSVFRQSWRTRTLLLLLILLEPKTAKSPGNPGGSDSLPKPICFLVPAAWIAVSVKVYRVSQKSMRMTTESK